MQELYNNNMSNATDVTRSFSFGDNERE